MSDETDFAGHPKTLGEARAERSAHGKDWAPRDVLITTLREIDGGEIDPYCMMVIFGVRSKESGTITHFYCAGPSSVDLLGHVHIAAFEYLRQEP